MLETQRARNVAAIEFVLAYFDLLEQEKIVAVIEKEREALEPIGTMPAVFIRRVRSRRTIFFRQR